MLLKEFSFAIFALPLLAGCAIHPSPRDIVPGGTVGIVDRIKCETRYAILDKARDKLRNNNIEGIDKERLSELAAMDDEQLAKLTASDIPGRKAKEFYTRYVNATIAYQFSLAASEEIANSAEIDFARVVTNGVVSVPFSASNDQMRLSTKTFLISETFKQLLAKTTCDRGAEKVDFEYPVSGNIGIYDIINTFIDLNEEKDLTQKPGANGLYTDDLVFTTMTTGGTIPKLALSSPTRAFHLTGAMLNNLNTRKDTETVTIGMSLPTPKRGQTTPALEKRRAADAIERQRTIQVQNSIIQFFSTH